MRYTPYMGVQGRDGQATGEQRLMLAMLEDSLRTVLGRSTAERSGWRQMDLAWIRSEDRTELFAFENVCDALGIDPSYLRAQVLAAVLACHAEAG
jgi:hypothetical protein